MRNLSLRAEKGRRQIKSLYLKIGFLLAILFALSYAGIAMIGSAMGIRGFYFYLLVSLAILGPRIW